MKLLIASDIHGSAAWCERLMQHIDAESPDAIVLLGDLLNHGPRNPLPDRYAPQEVADMLNGIAERIVAVRGNCDSEVDQMLLDFPCLGDYALLFDGSRKLFATHGHVFGPDNVLPLSAGSVVLSGHTHVKTNEERDGLLFINPGSVSLPKDGSRSCAVYENGAFRFVKLDD
ncbi:MAG: phosphodiesterase [Slackia sp.]|nr:phosphodiesterase [Slackia sp.]